MEYLTIKWLHILSSTILFGTGVGSAFYMFMANYRKDISAIYFAIRHVVIADFLFTTPSIIIQLVTGLWMVHLVGYELTDTWIMWGLILYFFAGGCWLPVVWIQIKMRDIAKEALEHNKELPKHYWRMYLWWVTLGSLAFPAIIVIFYLMVMKPV